MIYIRDDLNNIVMEEYQTMYSKMSRQRKKYVDRFFRQTDKIRCVCAYDLLMDALIREYGIVNPPEFGFKEYGKPYLREYPYIHFNISHCNNAVACAVSSEEIGIDVEDVNPIDNEVVNNCCSLDEIQQLNSADDPNLIFALIWTKKESFLKMMGTGLNDNVKNLFTSEILESVKFSTRINKQKRYVCTYCQMEII